jgi:hypothetical protein
MGRADEDRGDCGEHAQRARRMMDERMVCFFIFD